MTLDTGNFLERPYEQMGRMASSRVPIALVQAKTYYGGCRGRPELAVAGRTF